MLKYILYRISCYFITLQKNTIFLNMKLVYGNCMSLIPPSGYWRITIHRMHSGREHLHQACNDPLRVLLLVENKPHGDIFCFQPLILQPLILLNNHKYCEHNSIQLHEQWIITKKYIFRKGPNIQPPPKLNVDLIYMRSLKVTQ